MDRKDWIAGYLQGASDYASYALDDDMQTQAELAADHEGLAAAPAPPQAVQGEAVAWFAANYPQEYVALRGPINERGESEWERKAALYDHMKDVIEAAGFDSITACVAAATHPTPAMPIAASGDVEQCARELWAGQLRAKGMVVEAVGVTYGPWDQKEDAAIRAISAALRSQGQAVAVDDTARLDWLSQPNKLQNDMVLHGYGSLRDRIDAALAQQANKEAPKASA